MEYKIKKNLSGKQRFYWFAMYLLLVAGQAFYRPVILNEPGSYVSHVMTFVLLGSVLMIDVYFRFLGPYQFTSLTFSDKNITGRRYRNLSKYQFSVFNITKIEHTKCFKERKWMFGSRYTIRFSDSEPMSHIDIDKFYFDGVEELVFALIHSEHCPINHIEENEIGEKEF